MRPLKGISKRWNSALWINTVFIIVTSLMLFPSLVKAENWEGDPYLGTHNEGKAYRIVNPETLPSEGGAVIHVSSPQNVMANSVFDPSDRLKSDISLTLGGTRRILAANPVSGGWEITNGLEEYGISRIFIARHERVETPNGAAWVTGPYTCGSTGDGYDYCNGEFVNWGVPNATQSGGSISVDVDISDVKKFKAALYARYGSSSFGNFTVSHVFVSMLIGSTFTRTIQIAFPAIGCEFTVNGGIIDFGDISDKKIQGEHLLAQYGPQVHGSIDCPYENVSPGRYSIQLSQTSNGVAEPIYLKNDNDDILGWVDGQVQSGTNYSSDLCSGSVPVDQPLAQWLPEQNDVLSITWGLCNYNSINLPTGEYLGQGFLSVYLQ